jgi:hypothetical protein
MARRKFFADLGIGMDSILPGAVGGGTAMGGSLLLRAFVPQYVTTKDAAGVESVKITDGKPTESFWFKRAPLIAAGAGIAASLVVGYFKGWGSAAAGSIAALAVGVTAQFADTVAPVRSEVTGAIIPTAGYGAVLASRNPWSAYPYLYRGKTLGALQASTAQPGYPENVPMGTVSRKNMAAFGA